MRQPQQGFTLVELAIVMTIIGLLIGGILKGQELMENARVTATIAQVKSYEAATTTFRDTYAAMPGDMKNAATRVPGCNAVCDLVDAEAGNSIVGNPGQLDLAQNDIGTEPDKETVLFWTQLGLADLIAGVTDDIIGGGTPVWAWGESYPAAKLGGGFHVKHASGTALATVIMENVPSGLHLVLQNSPTEDLDDDEGVQAMSPARAAQIDRKMDDGQSTSGFVRGYGHNGDFPGTCSTTAATYPSGYHEGSTQKNCGLVFRIQG